MKRYISILLVMLILLSVLPMGAFAAKDGTVERDELIALACEVFPEYASKIRGEELTATNGLQRTTLSREIVKTETRPVSENETISYVEYSDGTVYLANSEVYLLYSPHSSFPDNSTTDVYVGSLIITSNLNDDALIIISNIKYAVVSNSADYVISVGNATSEYSASLEHAEITREYQSGSKPAEIKYDVHFTTADGSDTDPFDVYFRVIDGNCSCAWNRG